MNDIVGMRKEAIEYAQQACGFDNSGNIEDAIKYYIKAAEKLSMISKIDENKFNKETYKKKAMEYASRANELKNGAGNTNKQNSSDEKKSDTNSSNASNGSPKKE
jgi:hypothetical protein